MQRAEPGLPHAHMPHGALLLCCAAILWPAQCRVANVPYDAPDHSVIDPENVAAAFEKHVAKQAKRAQQAEAAAAAQQQQPAANGVAKEEL